MAGIAQTVLINSEPIAGYRGKLSNSNSLVFGSGAGTMLSAGDESLMSSINLTGVDPLGSGAWTIEYWANHTNIEFDEGIVHINGQAILGSANFIGGAAVFHSSSAVNLNNYLINNAVLTIPTQSVPTQTWQVNNWYHVALVKSTGSNVTAWVNGHRAVEGEVYSPNNYNVPFSILASWRNNQGVGTTNNFIGSLYNLRIVNSQLYDTTQSTITVPTRKLSLMTSTNLLLLAEKSKTFIDSANNATLSTRAGTTLFSASTPFNDGVNKYSVRSSVSSPFVINGSGSYYFYGRTNSYLTHPGSSRLAIGTGDFTIECFSYAQNESRTGPGMLWYETGGITDFGIYFEDVGANVDVYVTHGVTSINVGSIASNLYYKQWKHWAIIGTGGLIYCYCNGIALNPLGDSLTYNITSSSGTLYIGKKGSAAVQNECFYGYITNVRIVKDLSVYLGNFTVPSDNLQRFQFANPYGGSNTSAIRTDQTAFLMVP